MREFAQLGIGLSDFLSRRGNGGLVRQRLLGLGKLTTGGSLGGFRQLASGLAPLGIVQSFLVTRGARQIGRRLFDIRVDAGK